MAAPLIRRMTRGEVDTLVGWAATEGWNPGVNDAGIFWETDPEAFIAAELDGEVIGGGAITSYGGDFGFMGFFIIRPEYRSRGYGDHLWHARRERLLARLKPGAAIGMDGVFEMQPYYAKGGFAFAHRDIRYRLDVETAPERPGGLVALDKVPMREVLAYDRTCFPAAREKFLEAWISQPGAVALGAVRDGRLAGYGVIRRCGEGCKIGPLFADDGAVAGDLFAGLLGHGAGGPVFLDAPEANAPALDLAARHGMAEVFGCARMYLGPKPDLAEERIFGVTTFELG